MNKKPKKTAQYGLILDYAKDTVNFDDSQLFSEKLHFGTLLKSLKIYYKKNQRLFGLKCFFINFISGERKKGEYHGGDENSKDIETKELTVNNNEYIQNFEISMDEKFESINYIKITTNQDNTIEFGEKKGKNITILGFEGDNMIQSFFGNYDNNGINSIGFQYFDKTQFSFYNIFPIIKLRYIFQHDENFKSKYESNYKELLKDNISDIYLYRTCILPEALFAKIVKYC